MFSAARQAALRMSFSGGWSVVMNVRRVAHCLVLVVCLVTTTRVLAQGEAAIHGTVTARADGSLLPGAIVKLQGAALPTPLQATTGADGRFVFARLAPADYMLTVAHADFSEQRYRLSLKPREAYTLGAALVLRPVQEAVEVAAAVLPSVHSPGSTHLAGARLAEIPLTQRTNLPDAIVTAAPGMIRGHDDFVHIRGHEVALNPFINGVQFWENAHSVFSPGLGVDYIESMNVMTGGYSAEYGNRFGGILDVVTKSGFTVGNRGAVSLGTGSAQRHNVGLEFGGHARRAAYYLNLAGFTSDRFLSPPSPRSIHNTGRGLRGFGQLDVRLSDANDIKVVMIGDGVNFELPMEERDQVLRPDFRNLQRTRSQSLIASWGRVRSASTVVRTAVYQKWSSVHQFPDTIDRDGAQTDAERTLGTLGAKSDITRLSGRHTIKGGVDLVLLRPREDLSYLSEPWIDFTHLPNVNESHVHFRGPNLGPGVPRPVVFSGRESGGQASVFLQDKVQVTPNLTVDLGVRFDRYSLAFSESHVSPRVNAAYRLPSGTVLFGSYNHFYVPPPIENVLASSAGLTRLVSEIAAPLPPLGAITEHQFEAGVTQPIAGVLNVGVTSYYRVSDDPPHTTLFPDSRFYAYASFDKGKAYGMEIKADVPRVADLGVSAYLNYALGRVWFYNPIVAGFTTEAGHLSETGRFLAPMDQTNTLTAGLTYRNERTRLWGALALEYGSGTPGGHGDNGHEHENGEAHEHASGPGLCGSRCPSHFTQNVSVGWTASPDGSRPRLSLQFTVENLSNTVYLLSKESTMVQGQYSIPRLLSGALKIGF
jgi:outer membrane receptor protein involved in Fe transport